MLFKPLVALLAVASFAAALPLSPAMRHRELLDIIERTPKKQGWTSGREHSGYCRRSPAHIEANAFKRHLNIEDIKRSREQASEFSDRLQPPGMEVQMGRC